MPGGRVLISCVRLRWTGLTVGALSLTGAVLGSGAVPTQCPLRAAFGICCPFCGGTHAMMALVHGDVAAALSWNAFAVLVMLPVATAMLAAGARMELGVGRRLWPAGTPGKVGAIALGTALVAWTVLRNLSFASLAFLN
jgi:hypothetical protein